MRHISSLIGILFLTAFFIFGAGIYHANARLVKEVYVGDPGYPTFTESVATLNATGTSCTLYVPAGIHTVNDYLTVNSNVCLISRKVTAIRIESAKTLTINGPFEAGLYQVFDCIGTGKVVLGAGAVKEVYPQWWGGTGAAQVQAAIDSCAGPQVILVPGTYALGTTSLSLTKSYINFKALPGTKITYSGTGAAFLINPTSGILSNINVEFDLLVQNNAEAVGIKLDGDGWVQYSKFNWNWIDGTYNSAVVLAGAGLKNVNRFTGEKITSTRGSFQYGIKIPDGKTLFEGNRFDVGSIAGARTEGVYFGNTAWHNYFIGDVGNDNKANYSKVRIEGSRNTIQITGSAPLQDLFDQPAAPGEKEWYPTIHLGPNAVYNTIIISPHMMGGII